MSVPFAVPLPPSPFIREVSNELPDAPQSILDVGCYTGRHSILLARMGHRVLGLTPDFGEALAATQLAVLAAVSDWCNFVVGDVR